VQQDIDLISAYIHVRIPSNQGKQADDLLHATTGYSVHYSDSIADRRDVKIFFSADNMPEVLKHASSSVD
jgi:hypothetical protein